MTVYCIWPLRMAVLCSYLSAYADGLTVGLYASTGCYSHDALFMRLGHKLSAAGHRIVWIQNRIFDFGYHLRDDGAFTPTLKQCDNRPWSHNATGWCVATLTTTPAGESEPQNQSNWTSLVFPAVSPSSRAYVDNVQTRLWYGAVPYDVQTWYDPRPAFALFTIHRLHLDGCLKAVTGAAMVAKIRASRMGLVVVDHTLQEYATALVGHVGVPVMFLSNYPFIDTYLSPLGAFSSAASVPCSFADFPRRMHFAQRALNTVLLFVLATVRRHLIRRVHGRLLRASDDLSLPTDIDRTEADALLMGAPTEMLLEAPRPLTRRAQYFGCDHCLASGDEHSVRAGRSFRLEEDESDVVLVTFGSIMVGEKMPRTYVETLLRTFADLPAFTFVWQFGPNFKPAAYRAKVAPNVRIFEWIPLRTLLRSNRTRLLIAHGGVSTCLEAVFAAVPMLGVPLQGDQAYNLRRLVDVRVAHMLPSAQIVPRFRATLRQVIKRLTVYHNRALTLQRMLIDHRTLYGGSGSAQKFWTLWATRNLNRSKRFLFEVRTRRMSNWYELSLLATVFALLFVVAG